MKKNLLLLMAFAASSLFCSAKPGEFYLIKDGKLQNSAEVVQYEDEEENPIVKETVAPDGTDAVSVSLKATYKDALFYLANGVELKDYWNVEIEFYFVDGELDVHGHRGTDDGNKWSALNMGFVNDTVGNKCDIDSSFCQNSFDVKIKNKADVWNVERQMIYAPANRDQFKLFVLGWQRQIVDREKLGPLYIKNLKFFSETNRPFFAEDFNTQAAWNDVANHVQTYVVNANWLGEEGVEEDPLSENFNIHKFFHCGLPIYAGCEDGAKKYQGKTDLRRLYEDNGTDGSGYYDPELLHSINLVKPEGRTGRKGRTYFLIPTAGLEKAETFILDYLCKWDGSKYSVEHFAPTTPADSLVMQIKYAFVDDAVEANTCEMNDAFNPGDLLTDKWTAYHVEFPNTMNSKKYLALIFDKPEFFSYCVDNIRIAANNLSFEKATVEAHPVGVTSYGMVTDVKNVTADATAAVSPVPAKDVINVNNEGVEKVEVISTTGAVVASANGNQVNVSALATGVYVVKAYTAEGVLYAKIVKE